MGNHTNHPRHSGQFQKGEDKRRNSHGQRNAKAVALTRTIREILIRECESTLKIDGKRYKKIELMLRKVVNESMRGEAWAVQYVSERIEGKVADKHEVTGELAVKAYVNLSPDDWDDSTAST